MTTDATPAPSRVRLLVVHLFQVPAILLLCVSTSPWAWWPAALWGSVVCCAGTDSHWRWRNRLLIAEAVVWLLLGMSASNASPNQE